MSTSKHANLSSGHSRRGQNGVQILRKIERRKHAIISFWPTFWAFVSLALAAWGCAALTDGLARWLP